jgi:riboflavin-specific deaminase-like protein
VSDFPDPRLAAPTLRRLLPAGPDTTIEEFVATLARVEGDERRPAGEAASPDVRRPRVMLNMIATADGRARLDGRTASLGNRADRELFHALRSQADAVMVGAGTVRAERYGRIVRDPESRRRRAEDGRREEPLAVVVSNSLILDPALPLLSAPEAHVVVLTGSDGELAPCAAKVEYLRAPCDGDGDVDLPRALTELRARFGVAVVLCEGGPRLNAELLQDGAVDELFLSVAPKLAGGTEALRIVHGAELSPPAEMELLSVLESESHLFLRYAVAVR